MSLEIGHDFKPHLRREFRCKQGGVIWAVGRFIQVDHLDEWQEEKEQASAKGPAMGLATDAGSRFPGWDKRLIVLDFARKQDPRRNGSRRLT